MLTNRRVIRLGERRGDWFFVVCFGLFAFTSFLSDALAGLGVDFDPRSDSFWIRANYWYAANADPYFLSYPTHLRVQTFVSGFVLVRSTSCSSTPSPPARIGFAFLPLCTSRR